MGWVDKIAAKRPGTNKGEEKTDPGVAPKRKTPRQLRSRKTMQANTSLLSVSTPAGVNKFLAPVPGDVWVLQLVLWKLM